MSAERSDDARGAARGAPDAGNSRSGAQGAGSSRSGAPDAGNSRSGARDPDASTSSAPRAGGGPAIDRSTPQLGSLYQQLILEHYKQPRNRGALDAPTAEAHLHNPTCGDEIVLRVRVRDGVIDDARFEGQGCSISQASASMMTQLVRGRTVEEAASLAERFRRMMHGDADAAKDRAMGDLRALAGVSQFPVRIKCALLAFEALQQTLKRNP